MSSVRPDVWAYEIAPCDTASPEVVARAFRLLAAATFFGEERAFHPTSEDQERRSVELPDDVPVVTTDEAYDGIDYQPLNLGETIDHRERPDALDDELRLGVSGRRRGTRVAGQRRGRAIDEDADLLVCRLGEG